MESPIRGDGSSRRPELVQALLRQTEVCYTVVMATPAPHTQTHTHSNSNTHSQEQSHMWAWLPHTVGHRLIHKGSHTILGRGSSGWRGLTYVRQDVVQVEPSFQEGVGQDEEPWEERHRGFL